MLHRHARPAVAGGFLAGAVGGALLTGSVLALLAGLVSPVPAQARAIVALCGLVLLGLHQARVLCLDLPQRAWQIPQQVFHQPPVRAAARFAFELGTGVRTYITTAAPYGLALVLILAPGASATAALVGALLAALGYGIGRSIVVGTQITRGAIAVDHPPVWLNAAAWVSLSAAARCAWIW